MGAVIAHVMSDNTEHPIAYASRTPLSSEHNYVQIEKEALGIVLRVTKFLKFLYGCKFTLVTDHKPLLTLLGPKSQIPPFSSSKAATVGIDIDSLQLQYTISTFH